MATRRPKSPRFRQLAQQVSAPESPIVLLEIAHAALAQPMRFVNDSEDVVSLGQRWIAASFALVWPDDVGGQTPRAQVRISNARGIGAFFERSHGARGATLTVRQILRSQPDVLEDELILDIADISVTPEAVQAQLGFDNVLDRPGTLATYRPETAPGLF